jgi:hypothetical protein
VTGSIQGPSTQKVPLTTTAVSNLYGVLKVSTQALSPSQQMTLTCTSPEEKTPQDLLPHQPRLGKVLHLSCPLPPALVCPCSRWRPAIPSPSTPSQTSSVCRPCSWMEPLSTSLHLLGYNRAQDSAIPHWHWSIFSPKPSHPVAVCTQSLLFAPQQDAACLLPLVLNQNCAPVSIVLLDCSTPNPSPQPPHSCLPWVRCCSPFLWLDPPSSCGAPLLSMSLSVTVSSALFPLVLYVCWVISSRNFTELSASEGVVIQHTQQVYTCLSSRSSCWRVQAWAHHSPPEQPSPPQPRSHLALAFPPPSLSISSVVLHLCPDKHSSTSFLC